MSSAWWLGVVSLSVGSIYLYNPHILGLKTWELMIDIYLSEIGLAGTFAIPVGSCYIA